jgi:hypothetical protein
MASSSTFTKLINAVMGVRAHRLDQRSVFLGEHFELDSAARGCLRRSVVALSHALNRQGDVRARGIDSA